MRKDPSKDTLLPNIFQQVLLVKVLEEKSECLEILNEDTKRDNNVALLL